MELLRTARYTVDFSLEPAAGRPRHFGCSRAASADLGGYLLTFSPSGTAPWLGIFAGGVTQYTQVLSTPTEDCCCVVVDGQVFLVDVLNPDQSTVLPSCDILACVGDETTSALILVSFTDIIGIVSGGRWWRSERLASDGIRNVTISGEEVTGEGWQAHSDSWARFRLDAQTGRIL